MISNKCYYALKAMLELALREDQGPSSIAQIARAQQIPNRFLEAILRQLKQAGMTRSIRGKEGGYLLDRRADAVRLSEVIELFEGPLVAVNPALKVNGEICPFEPVWARARSALQSVYDATTFGQLADAVREERQRQAGDYAI